MRKSFRELYRKYRSSTRLTRRGVRKETAWNSFFYTLDDLLTDKKWYDSYYKYIWTPIWRLFKHYPKEITGRISVFFQRGFRGIARQDTWGLYDYFLEIAYKGIKLFLEDEYGKEPIDWSQRTCETHDRSLYKDLKLFVDGYEELLQSYKSEELLTDFEESGKKYEELIKLYKKIIVEHLEKLWI